MAAVRDRPPGGVRTAAIRIRFYPELGDLLEPELRGREFSHVCPAGDSAKDVIEGLGVPHTEVDLILVNGVSVGFDHHVTDGDWVSVYPVFEALDIAPVSAVRARPLRVVRFAADVQLGRLAGYLRLAGFDTHYRNDWKADQLTNMAVREHRMLLTRDRGLLMRRVVTHGYLVRSEWPREQLVEVLERFDLWSALRPFTRCSVCNGAIGAVAKAEVVAGLPPRTAAHYDEFWRCDCCGRVYWRGSHHRSLVRLFFGLQSLAALGPGGHETPSGEEGDAEQGEDPHGGDA